MKGKNVVITGATSGIGKATAFLFSEKGANVFVISRSQEKVDGVVKDLKEKNSEGKFEGAAADVGNFYEMDKAFEKVDDCFSKIDVFINNASISARSILNTSPDDWQGIIQTNLIGYMNGFHFAIERMRGKKEGHIVVTGSLSVKYKDPEADIYVASKTGVDGLVESLAPVIKDLGIKVTKIHPGNVGTGLVLETPNEQKKLEDKGKMLKAEDVANAILYSVSQPQTVNIAEIIIAPFEKV